MRDMKTTFELKTWMSENRETVIAKYNKLTAEKNFNGISLRDFMVQVYNMMIANNVKSEKRAESMLTVVMSNVYINNSNVQVVNDLDKKLAEQYKGTAFMALV